MYDRQHLNRRFWLLPVAVFVIALFSTSPAAANPLARNQDTSWAGTYSNSWGMSLTLSPANDGAYSGELTVKTDAGSDVYSVTLRKSSPSSLQGQFSSGAGAFPLSMVQGDESNQVVLTSEGNVYELEKESSKAANPLSRTAPSKPAVATSAGLTRFKHPDGYYTVDIPSDWESIVHSPDFLQFVTGRDSEIVFVLGAELEPDEIGKPLLELIPEALAVVDDFLDGIGIAPDSGRPSTETKKVGPLNGAVSRRSATDGTSQFAVWQGTIVKDDSAVLVVAAVEQGKESGLFVTMDSAFNSVRLDRAPDHRAVAKSARNVDFNGRRLGAEELRKLEGENSGLIPDGQYWYDINTGMVGQVGGPTLAYLAAGLNFCPPVAADASGGATSVAVNGRLLHPLDLAGLEYYFGAIQPNRYWMDSMGNYGIEGGAPLGNLLQQIAAIQARAAQGGYGGQGGNDSYYGGGGGSSVYRHFPNLGAGGTGVGVANLGGGDTIVNAGGVMWWPGK